MTTTVKKQTSNGTMVFTQRAKLEARQLFDEGSTISVMTADKTPDDTTVIVIDYTKGEELFWNAFHGIAMTFEQVKTDFAEWLGGDGYNHMPDHEAAENHNFSYWTCNIER